MPSIFWTRWSQPRHRLHPCPCSTGRCPHEQRNLLFGDAAARSPEVANLFADLKAELGRLRTLYADDDLYADPATWPKGGVDGVGADRPPLGVKTVADAIALSK